MTKYFLFSFLLASQFALAGDLGFRYTDGECKNANGELGLNPSYFGECGDLRGTVTKMNLDGVNLRGSKFDSSDLRGSTFKNADLLGTVFSSANIAGVDFMGAEMTNSKLLKVTGIKANFAGAHLRNANLSESNFEEAIFTEASLIGAKMQKSNLKKSVAKNIKLQKANLENSDIRYADFSGATFSESILKGCKFNNKTKLSITKDEAAQLGMILLNLYEFAGILTKFKMALLDGWQVCHQGLYSSIIPAGDELMKSCKAKFVMLACRKTGADVIEVAAYGKYENVFKDVGNGNDGTIDNGVQFYYSNDYSLGFAPVGANLQRSSCDVDRTQAEQRLCYHTHNYVGGYSCGSEASLNSSQDYERLIFKSEE
jgi:uncharacterized protein YjbI with pentapeptide repeats